MSKHATSDCKPPSFVLDYSVVLTSGTSETFRIAAWGGSQRRPSCKLCDKPNLIDCSDICPSPLIFRAKSVRVPMQTPRKEKE
jgi:hypothetical protein